MVKAIIFDCFGVLVGTGFWNIYRDAGGDPEKDWEFVDAQLRRTNAGEISADVFRALMADRLGISFEQFMSLYNREEVPNTELLAFIRNELKSKYKIGVISNAAKGVVESRLPAADLELFDDLCISADVGLQKPDPAIYTLSCERLGVQLHEAVFTDDQPRFLAPAAEIGMSTVLFVGVDDLRTKLVEIDA